MPGRTQRGSILVVIVFLLVFLIVIGGVFYLVGEFRKAPLSRTVQVAVRDEGDRPVAGATVTVYNRRDAQGARGTGITARTDERGEATLDILGWRTVSIVATAEGYGRGVTEHFYSPEETRVLFHLLPGSRLEGKVVGEGGPETGAWVVLLAGDWEVFVDETDEEGRYAFADHAAGSYTVFSWHRRPTPADRTAFERGELPGHSVVKLVSGEVSTQDLQPDVRFAIRGTVTLNGHPWQELAVLVYRYDETDEWPWKIDGEGVTDPEGRFEVAGLGSREESWIAVLAATSRNPVWAVGRQTVPLLKRRLLTEEIGQELLLAVETTEASFTFQTNGEAKPPRTANLTIQPDVESGGVPGCEDCQGFNLQISDARPISIPFLAPGFYRARFRYYWNDKSDWQPFEIGADEANEIVIRY